MAVDTPSPDTLQFSSRRQLYSHPSQNFWIRRYPFQVIWNKPWKNKTYVSLFQSEALYSSWLCKDQVHTRIKFTKNVFSTHAFIDWHLICSWVVDFPSHSYLWSFIKVLHFKDVFNTCDFNIIMCLTCLLTCSSSNICNDFYTAERSWGTFIHK